jgi:acetoacetyl-CoA synthetase
MEKFSEFVDDSLCIGQRRQQDEDERVLLFLKMRPGHKFTPKLVTDIKTAIRRGLSARHVPAYIFEVSDIPVGFFLYLLGNTAAKTLHISSHSTRSTVKR